MRRCHLFLPVCSMWGDGIYIYMYVCGLRALWVAYKMKCPSSNNVMCGVDSELDVQCTRLTVWRNGKLLVLRTNGRTALRHERRVEKREYTNQWNESGREKEEEIGAKKRKELWVPISALNASMKHSRQTQTTENSAHTHNNNIDTLFLCVHCPNRCGNPSALCTFLSFQNYIRASFALPYLLAALIDSYNCFVVNRERTMRHELHRDANTQKRMNSTQIENTNIVYIVFDFVDWLTFAIFSILDRPTTHMNGGCGFSFSFITSHTA